MVVAIWADLAQDESPLENGQLQSPEDLDDGSDRAAFPIASASANAAAGGSGLRPGPGPGPRPPGPDGLRHECLACAGCPSAQNATVKQCAYSFDPSKKKRCVIYGEKYHHMKNPWVIRGCASERGSCADIKASHENLGDLVKLLYCKECEGDRCNDSNGAGIPHSIPDLFMAFLAMIVTPIVTKYSMS
ncbi:hypothetical protein MSG28_013154 [Choristoneura fumiferana]|uniref:Uncharacterized protein n=1 Tax=Choristoneura fumiferana TaxID=7141 RepID=A0ACC0KS82_CHOFU|nr:hypothetical protein MSG28_013154 [Choristoneura fumiferana]